MRANRAFLRRDVINRSLATLRAARPGPSRDKKRLAQDDNYILVILKEEEFE